MSKYTTGEIAKLCDVTVRTVQYYDNRNLLIPSELTEGGRRLYSDEDVQRLKTICFLRDLGLSLNTISELLKEEHPEKVIDLLLQQQEETLKKEMDELQNKLTKVDQLKKGLKNISNFSVETIGDVAQTMENKKKLRKARRVLLAVGIPLGIIEIGTLLYWIFTGTWWPFVLWFCGDIIISIFLVKYYYKQIALICPQCHEVFRPTFKDFFWSNHTPTTRNCTCTKCGHSGFCVETYGGDLK
ncbi:MAG: MerR family transcriptional regulator [Firmicutes bacterium]|nr:MerR family transcriptional regulator [Bacillota bacterium]